MDDGGTDRVQSSITHALGAFLENLTPTGLAYDAASGTRFLSDSEVDESPFSPINLFALDV